MKDVATAYAHIRVISETPPQDRSIGGLLALFGLRSVSIATLGITLALLQLAIIAVATGHPTAMLLLALVSCLIVVAGTVGVYKRIIARRIDQAELLGLNVVEHDEAPQSNVDVAKHTAARLLSMEQSLKTVTKSLDELEGRAAFLQTYVEALHEQERDKSLHFETAVAKQIEEIQERMALLGERVENMLREAVDQDVSTRPERPR
jgi:hypothetical protein